jgi:transcriptional regulator GlxA family with amidase domain
MTTVGLVAFDNCLLSAVAGMLDLFLVNEALRQRLGLADHLPPLGGWVLSPDGGRVAAPGGLSIEAMGSLDHRQRLDAVVMMPALVDAEHSVSQHPRIVSWLIEQHSRKTLITCVCTGTFFVAEAGLLDGRSATTNPALAGLFRQRYPAVNLRLGDTLVDEGDVISAGATVSFLELGLHLIARYQSATLARATGAMFLATPAPRSQQPFVSLAGERTHGDEKMRDVQRFLENNYRGPIVPEQLAATHGMSVRSLTRRFKESTGYTLVAYLQAARVEAAKRALEETQRTLEEVTCDVGYNDSRSFSRLFQRRTGLSPREYRRRFAAGGPRSCSGSA